MSRSSASRPGFPSCGFGIPPKRLSTASATFSAHRVFVRDVADGLQSDVRPTVTVANAKCPLMGGAE
jgi:hypothetical protein